MSPQDTQVNTAGCIFLPKTKLFKTLYLRRVARTCIFVVHVGTAFIGFNSLIRSLRPKTHVFASSYLFLVLHNCEDLSIKHNIELVGTEYPRPQNSTWLEKAKSIFKIVMVKVYVLFKS